MKFQKLYLVGLQKQDLNVGKVAETFLLASWDALILFFLTMFAFQVRSSITPQKTRKETCKLATG
jgi:hypothetical protein